MMADVNRLFPAAALPRIEESLPPVGEDRRSAFAQFDPIGQRIDRRAAADRSV
jgi:hypothetical protein